MAVALDDLDATGALALVEEVLLARRAAEVDDLRLAARWADLPPPTRGWARRGGGNSRRAGTGWSRSAGRAPRWSRTCASPSSASHAACTR